VTEGSAVRSGAVYGTTAFNADTDPAAPSEPCSVCGADVVPGTPLCLTHLRVVARVKHGASPEPPEHRQPTHSPVVYYALFGDRVKIGTTTDLVGRMGAVPHDHLLATEPGGREVERRRHEQFATWHATGEWFHHCPAIAAHIETLI